MAIRTLSQILIDADKCKSPACLQSLADELVKNKFQYPLCELTFGLEHILELGEGIKAKIQFEHLMRE